MIGLQRNLDPNNGLEGGGLNVGDLIDNKDLNLPPTETPEEKVKREELEKTNTETALKVAEALKAEAKVLGLAETATKEEIEKAKEALAGGAPAELELDGKVYKINAEGNAVDESGKVIKTKAEIEQIATQQALDEKPLVKEIYEKAGYKILDDKGKEKVYEDTPEGIIEFATDVAILKANEAEKRFFELYPDIKEFAAHLQRGGTKADYFKRESESWGNIKFDEKNEDLLKSVVVADLVKTGMSKEKAETTAQLYKDTDKLKDFGKDAYDRLVKTEKDAKKLAEDTYAKQELESTKRVEEYWKNTSEIIKKGTLNSITIPEADRDSFYEYIAQDVNGKGESQSFVDRQKLPTQQLLELEYLQYKGFKLNDLIVNTARTQQTKSLRSRIVVKQNGNGGGEGNKSESYVKPSDVNISLDTLST